MRPDGLPAGSISRRRLVVPRRHSHLSQRGLTLIEMVLTIAVITLGAVGIAAGLAQSEHIAGVDQDQAQLEVAMRQVSGYVANSAASGLTYKVCAAPDQLLARGISHRAFARLRVRPQGG